MIGMRTDYILIVYWRLDIWIDEWECDVLDFSMSVHCVFVP